MESEQKSVTFKSECLLECISNAAAYLDVLPMALMPDEEMPEMSTREILDVPSFRE